MSCFNDSDVVFKDCVHVDFEDLFNALSAEMAPLFVIVLIPDRCLHHHDSAFIADAAVATGHNHPICNVAHAHNAFL